MHSEYHLDSDTENVPTGDLEFNTFVIEEVLISEVLERPCLWDHTMDIKIKGMDTVRKAWEEIGQVLSMYICFYIILFKFACIYLYIYM
ncbi:hypothetical protein PUN28_003594 [Cardiocondyla obscurior]|uniref:MADF domain-containing protein n=1 Tax=Cardiocondyla obscurior TaxID=286306 RepID=A0AAW2GMR5_9HYME